MALSTPATARWRILSSSVATDDSYCSPATTCRDVLDRCGAVLVRPASAELVMRAWQVAPTFPGCLSAAGGELPGVDPVVDDAGAAAQPPGGLGHGDLAGAAGIRDRDLVGVADPLDRIDVEWPAVAGAVPGGIEPGDQLVVAGGRPEPLNQFAGGGRGV